MTAPTLADNPVQQHILNVSTTNPIRDKIRALLNGIAGDTQLHTDTAVINGCSIRDVVTQAWIRPFDTRFVYIGQMTQSRPITEGEKTDLVINRNLPGKEMEGGEWVRSVFVRGEGRVRCLWGGNITRPTQLIKFVPVVAILSIPSALRVHGHIVMYSSVEQWMCFPPLGTSVYMCSNTKWVTITRRHFPGGWTAYRFVCMSYMYVFAPI